MNAARKRVTNETDRISVILADDHTLVRVGVRKILEGDRRFTDIREVTNGTEALAALRTSTADVMVLDLTMPGQDGFAVMSEAKNMRPDLKILVLTMHSDPEYVTRAVKAGADGYLIKDSAVQELVSGIDAILSGDPYYGPAVQQALSDIVRNGASQRSVDHLTGREREVLKLVAQGMSTKEIASDLAISARTVESHRANLMRKLELRSVALLTQFAIREGIVRPA